MGKVLVSFASKGREDYRKAQLALIKSSKKCVNWEKNWHNDYYIRCLDGYVDKYEGVEIIQGSYPVTEKYGVSWQHSDNPYQFKPFAVWEAYEKGYKQILWCDSTVQIMKNPDPLWEKCAERGILAWDNEGHPLKPYINTHAKKWLQVENIDGWKQIMACCIMFDFNHPKTVKVVEEWIQASLNNCFYDGEGAEIAHKHDQAVLSALLTINGIEIEPYGELAYPHHTPIKPYFLNVGVQ